MLRTFFIITIVVIGIVALSLGSFGMATGGAVGNSEAATLMNGFLVLFILAGLLIISTPFWRRWVR